jgi:hypothetical protein
VRFTGFIGPSYTLRSVNVDCQRCINLYPEIDEIGTGKEREVAALIGTPGLSLLATVGAGPIRGEWYSSTGRLFVVSGNTLYEVDSSWAATSRGTLITSVGQVSIADNGLQLVIVDGANGYALTLATNAFAQIVDPNFPGADIVVYQDGYFIFNKPNSAQFFISGIFAVTFDAADVAVLKADPNDIVGLISDRRDLWLFSKQTAQVFFNSGATFPFEPVQGAFIEYGCAAKFSIAKTDDSVFWLAKTPQGGGTVLMAKGYQPQRISTHAVELAIQGYSDISDATAYTYQDNGHHFYVLNFPTGNATWVFDTTTSLWHERAYLNNGSLDRHRAGSHAFAFNTHIVGDYSSGNIYSMDLDHYLDNGSPILRERTAPHISQDMLRNFHHLFQLDIETGTGLDGTTQGTDPQAMLQFSDDSGHSWSNEKWTSFGKIGQTKARAIWRRLGQSRDRVYRLRISDPVKVVLLGAELGIEPGAS